MSEPKPDDVTGQRALPPTPPEARESDPPVTRKGASWKVIGAALGFLATVSVPTGAIIARSAVLEAKVDEIAESTAGMRERQQIHREELAVLKTRVLRVEDDVTTLKRRHGQDARER